MTIRATAPIASLALAGMLGAAPPPATPAAPSGTPAATPATTPPAGTSASQPSAASPTHVLDGAVFAHGIDALGDIKPVTRMVSRFPARITGATLDVGEPGTEFSQRTVRSAIELTCVDARGTVKVLGSFGWDGPVLQWSWNRVSPRMHGKAIDALTAALALCSLDVKLEGGAHVRVEPPPRNLRAAIHAGDTQRLKVAVPAGRAIAVEVAPDARWTAPAEEPPPGTVARHAECGDVRISWDAAASECVVEWQAPGVVELEALRVQIAERRRESARRSADEQRIIEAEIADLERKAAEYAAALPMSNAPFAPFPSTVLKGPDGRVYARLEIVATKKASK